jgi:hypothetical protein
MNPLDSYRNDRGCFPSEPEPPKRRRSWLWALYALVAIFLGKLAYSGVVYFLYSVGILHPRPETPYEKSIRELHELEGKK